ncbi:MAG TPA: hypothetical protein VF997_02565 [Polyangia bacterium]
MSRRAAVLAAAGLAGALACAAVVVACSGSNCAPGTLLLHLALLDDGPLADTITVSGDDPGAAVSNSFPHAPNPSAAAIGVEHVDAVVTWPQGYPAHAAVNLTIRALAGGAQLGVGAATVRLDPSCSETSLLVSNRGVPPDFGGSD